MLGVCEVENEYVIHFLNIAMNSVLNRQCTFVISEGDDKRGIDTAPIFDTAKYSPEQVTFSIGIIK